MFSNPFNYKVPVIREESRKINVKVWYPSTEKGRVGHVALRAPGDGSGGLFDGSVRASFWPKGDPTKKHHTISEFRNGCSGQNLNAPPFIGTRLDSALEGELPSFKGEDPDKGSPDLSVNLYGLHVDSVKKSFNAFDFSSTNWSVFGSSCYPIKAKNTSNCSGLVYDLLQAGGIHKLSFPYASVFRRTGLLFTLLIFSSVLAFSPNREKFFSNTFESIVSLTLLSTFTLMGTALSGAIGGVIDGCLDGWELGRTMRAGHFANPYVVNELTASIPSTLLGAACSMFGCDHAVHKFFGVTPGHVAQLVKEAKTIESPVLKIS